MIQRELTMTVICQAPCDNQYGAWRTQCPVCGRQTPKKAHEAAVKPTTRQHVVRTVRTREPHATACVFCHRRGAKEQCAHCNEKIHHNCQGLHGDACKQFQVERQVEITRLQGGQHDSI